MPTARGSVSSLISNIVATYFQIRDRDHDGLIAESDLRSDFSEKEAEIIAEVVDTNDNGSIDMEEMRTFFLIRPVTERHRKVRHFLRL